MRLFKHLDFKKYKNTDRTLASVCPWELMVEDGIMLEKGGVLCCAYEFLAPDLGSSPASKIANVSYQFNNAVMQLGEGWCVQFELQRFLTSTYPSATFSNLTGTLIDRQRELLFSYQKSHYENRYFLIFSYQLPPELKMKGVNAFYNAQGQDENRALVMIQTQIKEFKNVVSRAVAVLKASMRCERLDSDGLFSLIHASVSLDWSKRILPEDYAVFLDDIVTDCDLETSEPMKLGDYYIPVVTIKSFPSRTFPAIFNALNSADCSLRWSTRFICLSRQQAEKRIKKASDKFHGAHQSMGQMLIDSLTKSKSGKVNAAAVAQEDDANVARQELYMSDMGYGDYLSNVLVFDRDLEAAEDNAKYVAGLITACGFSAKEETKNAFYAFLAMQPGNVYADARKLFVSTGNLSHVVPASSIWSGVKNNRFMQEISGCAKPLLVCATDFNMPFYLTLNVKDVGHSVLIGPTGAGKSTALAAFESAWFKYPGARVIVFDKGKSARSLSVCCGGMFIEPGKNNCSFQPLVEIDDPLDAQWACQFIEMLLVEQKVSVSPKMKSAINETIDLLKTMDKSSRNLTTFCQYCDYQNPETKGNDIEGGLSPYVLNGQFGPLFDSTDGASSILFGRQMTVFEMEYLMEFSSQVVAPALFYIFHQCEKQFDGKPTLMVLDEAWLFLGNPVFAAKLREWLKVLRKKHVFVVFASQEINDAINSPIASTIIEQCPTKIYLANDEAETDMVYDAYRKFGLEPSEIRVIQRMQKQQDYFYKSSLGTRKFQLMLDEFQLAILTCSPDDHKMLDAIEERHGQNTGRELVGDVLDAKGIEWRYLLQKTHKKEMTV